jgi:hypothetical protein
MLGEGVAEVHCVKDDEEEAQAVNDNEGVEHAVAVSDVKAVAAFEEKGDDDAHSVAVGEMLSVCDTEPLCVATEGVERTVDV